MRGDVADGEYSSLSDLPNVQEDIQGPEWGETTEASETFNWMQM